MYLNINRHDMTYEKRVFSFWVRNQWKQKRIMCRYVNFTMIYSCLNNDTSMEKLFNVWSDCWNQSCIIRIMYCDTVPQMTGIRLH
jgi:hypothetical protein